MNLLIRHTLATHQGYDSSQNVVITPPTVMPEHMFRPVVTGHKNLRQVTLVNNKNSVVTWDVTSTSEESIRVVYNRLQLELAAAGGMIIE